MQSLFRSKKGQIPIISDILNAVVGFFQSLIQAAPGPARIIIFLLLISVGAILLSFMVRLLGYHCDDQGLPMHVSSFNLYANIKLITTTPDQTELNTLSRKVSGGSAIPTIVNKECYLNNAIATAKRESGATFDWNNKNAYSQGFVQCVMCDLVTYTTPGSLSGIPATTTAACIGDAYRIENRSLIQKTFCGWYVCEPPQNYYWKQSTNEYICTNNAVCGNYTIGRQWHDNLISSGATYLYPGGFVQQVDSDSVFALHCEDTIRPVFTIYGIPILDYRIWLFGILLLVVLAFYVHSTRK